MHPYMSHLMAEEHIADLRREAEEHRLARAWRDNASRGGTTSGRTSRRAGSPAWLRVRALVRRFATA